MSQSADKKAGTPCTHNRPPFDYEALHHIHVHNKLKKLCTCGVPAAPHSGLTSLLPTPSKLRGVKLNCWTSSADTGVTNPIDQAAAATAIAAVATPTARLCGER